MKKQTVVEEEIMKMKEFLDTVHKPGSEFVIELEQLEKFVVSSHYTVDSQLGAIIAYKILLNRYRNIPFGLEQRLLFWDIQRAVEVMSYKQKVEALQRLHVKEEITKPLMALNDLRNQFAHKLTHKKQIHAYKNRDKYKEVLRKVKDTYVMTHRIMHKQVYARLLEKVERKIVEK